MWWRAPLCVLTVYSSSRELPVPVNPGTDSFPEASSSGWLDPKLTERRRLWRKWIKNWGWHSRDGSVRWWWLIRKKVASDKYLPHCLGIIPLHSSWIHRVFAETRMKRNKLRFLSRWRPNWLFRIPICFLNYVQEVHSAWTDAVLIGSLHLTSSHTATCHGVGVGLKNFDGKKEKCSCKRFLPHEISIIQGKQ